MTKEKFNYMIAKVFSEIDKYEKIIHVRGWKYDGKGLRSMDQPAVAQVQSKIGRYVPGFRDHRSTEPDPLLHSVSLPEGTGFSEGY